jgi:hypothetical protein
MNKVVVFLLLLSLLLIRCESNEKNNYQLIDVEKINLPSEDLSFLFSTIILEHKEYKYLFYFWKNRIVKLYDSKFNFGLEYKSNIESEDRSIGFVLIEDTLIGFTREKKIYFENIKNGGLRVTNLDEWAKLDLSQYKVSFSNPNTPIFIIDSFMYVPLLRGDMSLMSLSNLKKTYRTSGLLKVDLNGKEKSEIINTFPPSFQNLDGHYYSFGSFSTKLKDSYFVGFELTDTLYEYKGKRLITKYNLDGSDVDLGKPIDTLDLFDMAKMKDYLFNMRRWGQTIYNSNTNLIYRVINEPVSSTKNSHGKKVYFRPIKIKVLNKSNKEVSTFELSGLKYSSSVFFPYKNGFVLLNKENILINPESKLSTLSYFELRNEN